MTELVDVHRLEEETVRIASRCNPTERMRQQQKIMQLNCDGEIIDKTREKLTAILTTYGGCE